MAKYKEVSHYPETDVLLYDALEKYPVKNMQYLIIGSGDPYYEGMAIRSGSNATMLEYQRVTSAHPKLKTMTVDEFEKDEKLFDGAISISSVEHSGLGRYGDPLDPDGDLKAMEFLFREQKPGAYCFLAVPIGKDQILWNAHRVYGRIRFPMSTKGLETVESLD